MNINRNTTVDGTRTSATLTELSEYARIIHCVSHLTVIVHTWVPHLAPHTVYQFRVQAETAVGPGPFSSPRTFTTPENGMITIVQLQLYFKWVQHAFNNLLPLVPTEPRRLTVMYLNSTSLEVTWEHPLCDYGIRRGYTVSQQT